MSTAVRPSAALTRRSRTRSRNSPVAMRVNVTMRSESKRQAVGHIAGRKGGDGEGLACAGARFEQRHAGGQRAARIERFRYPAQAHWSTIRS